MSVLALVSIFLLIGFFAGILIGMLGIGGGLVFVPVLYYLLPLIKVPYANLTYFTLGTSLFAGALATSNSAFLHIKKNNYSKKPALIVSDGAVITAFIAPFFVVKVKSEIIEFIFASVMLLVALRMIFENNKIEKAAQSVIVVKMIGFPTWCSVSRMARLSSKSFLNSRLYLTR